MQTARPQAEQCETTTAQANGGVLQTHGLWAAKRTLDENSNRSGSHSFYTCHGASTPAIESACKAAIQAKNCGAPIKACLQNSTFEDFYNFKI